jgi:hypothetical protein
MSAAPVGLCLRLSLQHVIVAAGGAVWLLHPVGHGPARDVPSDGADDVPGGTPVGLLPVGTPGAIENECAMTVRPLYRSASSSFTRREHISHTCCPVAAAGGVSGGGCVQRPAGRRGGAHDPQRPPVAPAAPLQAVRVPALHPGGAVSGTCSACLPSLQYALISVFLSHHVNVNRIC